MPRSPMRPKEVPLRETGESGASPILALSRARLRIFQQAASEQKMPA